MFSSATHITLITMVCCCDQKKSLYWRGESSLLLQEKLIVVIRWASYCDLQSSLLQLEKLIVVIKRNHWCNLISNRSNKLFYANKQGCSNSLSRLQPLEGGHDTYIECNCKSFRCLKRLTVVTIFIRPLIKILVNKFNFEYCH